jgi:hypothetical protein
MRLMLGMTMGLLTLTGLAACGQNEQALRTTTREGLLLGCKNGDAATRTAMAQSGINVDRFCTCAVDRYMQTASIEELRRLNRTAGPNATPPAAFTAAAGQCMTEMVSQSTPAAGATPPAANEGAAAPSEAPAEGAAPAEENTAEH